ncbi:hypothetical protein B0H12DRAFT_1242533 [Mycena haematopus]|nr:hypothetical protein B0H12DRAFT_1243379 [Mycena haematopus]KAJ7211832.1 hypothetical protein B0H12DRAFT_1242533 [Mycena haematopus]
MERDNIPDESSPQLVVTLDRQLRLPPTDPQWRSILETMNPTMLFRTALRSSIHCSAVVEYLSTSRPNWLVEDNISYPADGLQILPAEVRQSIVEHMPLLTRIRFGQTSKAYRSLCALVMRLCVADLVGPYHISYNVIRFLQIVADIVLSGSAIPWLILFPRQSVKGFTPNDLDFYVPRSHWDGVLSFFALGTPYVHTSSEPGHYPHLPSVRAFSRLKIDVGDQRSLNLMCCVDDNPFGPCTQFHSTCVVGCVTAYRAWFPYAELTTRYISILNRRYVGFAGPLEVERALLAIRKYQSRGFTIDVDYTSAHVCGLSPNCPSTVRVSTDAGCSSISFPSVAKGRDWNVNRTPTLWIWQGVGCRNNAVQKAQDAHGKLLPSSKLHAYSVADSAWELIADHLIQYPRDAPVSQILSWLN